MLTPKFELEQFEDFILVRITAKYIKTNDVEIYMEDNEFKFYVKPYFLRLYFPCHIAEDGTEKAEYDISTGVFTINVPKKTPGEHFPDLDMLTTLLAKKTEKLVKSIEVVGEMENNRDCVESEEADAVVEEEEEEEELDWEVNQELYEPPNILTGGYKYGFANKFSDAFTRLHQGELQEILDLPDPQNTSPLERRAMRFAEEKVKFDSQHYVADLMDDLAIQELIKYRAPWDIEYDRILTAYKASYPETSELITPKGNHSVFNEDEKFAFSEEEKTALVQLPNKDYILDKDEEHTVFLCLVDVIFSYAYNHRTTTGENSSESPWTVCKVSSTLSWLDTFKSPHDVLCSGARRCLCYPLYRHWMLVQKVIDDVRRIFLLGRRWILRCLLELRSILQQDENKYMLNELYVTDLCSWIQKTKKKKILSICNKLQCIKVSKEDVQLDLVNVERSVNEWVDDSSGDEEDSSESSDETVSSSEEESESSEEESSSCSSEIVSSLDSDDFDEDEVRDVSGNVRSNEPCVEPAGQDCQQQRGRGANIVVIKTGLEELLHAQKLVDSEDIEVNNET